MLEALPPDCADPTFGHAVGLGRSYRRADHLRFFGPEHLVERGGELRVPVVNEEPDA